MASADHFPPGIVGEVARYIHRSAPYPNPDIALAGAFALMAGICGRAFNVSGAGLNLYVLVLAVTGSGKEANADAISRLMEAVGQTVPAARTFRGPGELASAPGLFKWLADNPAIICVIGEFGLMLKLMANPKAPAHLAGLQRVLLQMYSKSGQGSVFDAAAYSDKANNVPAIRSPSLTLLGEGVPETFYGALDESMVASGLLPRITIFEAIGPRPYQNADRQLVPCPQLVQRLADLTAQAIQLGFSNLVQPVEMTPEAKAFFVGFERRATDEINGGKSDVTRQLWNRAHLKAMKLAALVAVGENYLAPLITLPNAESAVGLTIRQTQALLAKFAHGEVGAEAGSEEKQLDHVITCIAEFLLGNPADFANYIANPEMHARGVFTEAYLSRRSLKVKAFSEDRGGATRALKRALQNLLDADEIAELPKAQTQEEFGHRARSFLVKNPARVLEVARRKKLIQGGG